MRNSKRFTNAQGVEQGTCVHLGNCDIGCDVDAKNTLDRNYLSVGREAGRRRPPAAPGHRRSSRTEAATKCRFDALGPGEPRFPAAQTARIVIVAAGSLDSTELLLRCRDVTGTLPNVSPLPRPQLEQQRRFPDAGVLPGPRRATHRKGQPSPAPSTSLTAARRPELLDRGRRLPQPAP